MAESTRADNCFQNNNADKRGSRSKRFYRRSSVFIGGSVFPAFFTRASRQERISRRNIFCYAQM